MAEQPKEFYCKYQGFEFKSGVDDGAGRTIDWEVITDNIQGIKFCTDGTHWQLNYKNSYEICGKDCAQGDQAKVIRAVKGNIVIEAKSGDIILRGDNVRIQARGSDGECTINAGKQVATKAAITSVSGTKVNIMGTSDVNIGGAAVETNAKVVNSQSQATDEKQASFLGQIMSAIKKFKELLECAAG